MGNEATCKVHFDRQQSEGKALLETSEILFRGAFRLKIPFSTIKSAKAVDGELRLQTSDGLAVFHLGPIADKWRDKILHPKSRIDKLGVTTEARVSLLGAFEPEFLREVAGLTKNVSRGKVAADAGWIFLAVDSKADLAILHNMGQKHITESDVLAAGRKSGLRDVKVVGFSATHTALKFVIPLSKR